MNERYAYYERRDEATANPGEVMSCIIDGMAQNHTSCPYFANQVKHMLLSVTSTLLNPYSKTYLLVQIDPSFGPENSRCH